MTSVSCWPSYFSDNNEESYPAIFLALYVYGLSLWWTQSVENPCSVDGVTVILHSLNAKEPVKMPGECPWVSEWVSVLVRRFVRAFLIVCVSGWVLAT